jgi:hypothetical protein
MGSPPLGPTPLRLLAAVRVHVWRFVSALGRRARGNGAPFGQQAAGPWPLPAVQGQQDAHALGAPMTALVPQAKELLRGAYFAFFKH